MTRSILFIATFSLLSATQVTAQTTKEKERVVENKTISTYRNSCTEPASNARFYEFFHDLTNEYEFDSERLRVARMGAESECFTSKQIKIILTGFTYESTRIAFAKYAYAYVFDRTAYETIKDGFLRQSSWEEVEDYINNH